jgi:hypothetical protein
MRWFPRQLNSAPAMKLKPYIPRVEGTSSNCYLDDSPAHDGGASGGGILGDELGGFGRHGGGDGGVGASASHPGVVVCGWQQKARHATR